MKKLFIIPITLLIIVGCAKKQELITPEKPLEVIEIVSADSVSENIKVENIAVTPVVETLIEPEPAAVEEIFPEQEEVVEELPEIIEVSEPQTSIQRELDYDQLFPDSIWTEYMTKRGDYLSLIAYKNTIMPMNGGVFTNGIENIGKRRVLVRTEIIPILFILIGNWI